MVGSSSDSMKGYERLDETYVVGISVQTASPDRNAEIRPAHLLRRIAVLARWHFSRVLRRKTRLKCRHFVESGRWNIV